MKKKLFLTLVVIGAFFMVNIPGLFAEQLELLT